MHVTRCVPSHARLHGHWLPLSSACSPTSCFPCAACKGQLPAFHPPALPKVPTCVLTPIMCPQHFTRPHPVCLLHLLAYPLSFYLIICHHQPHSPHPHHVHPSLCHSERHTMFTRHSASHRHLSPAFDSPGCLILLPTSYLCPADVITPTARNQILSTSSAQRRCSTLCPCGGISAHPSHVGAT